MKVKCSTVDQLCIVMDIGNNIPFALNTMTIVYIHVCIFTLFDEPEGREFEKPLHLSKKRKKKESCSLICQQ